VTTLKPVVCSLHGPEFRSPVHHGKRLSGHCDEPGPAIRAIFWRITMKNGDPPAGCVTCFLAIVWAAPPLTTIQDVLYKADGTLFQGLLIIEWRASRRAIPRTSQADRDHPDPGWRAARATGAHHERDGRRQLLGKVLGRRGGYSSRRPGQCRRARLRLRVRTSGW